MSDIEMMTWLTNQLKRAIEKEFEQTDERLIRIEEKLDELIAELNRRRK